MVRFIYPLVNSHRPWQIGVGRLVSIKNGWFPGSMFIYQRVNQPKIKDFSNQHQQQHGVNWSLMTVDMILDTWAATVVDRLYRLQYISHSTWEHHWQLTGHTDYSIVKWWNVDVALWGMCTCINSQGSQGEAQRKGDTVIYANQITSPQ